MVQLSDEKKENDIATSDKNRTTTKPLVFFVFFFVNFLLAILSHPVRFLLRSEINEYFIYPRIVRVAISKLISSSIFHHDLYSTMGKDQSATLGLSYPALYYGCERPLLTITVKMQDLMLIALMREILI